MNETQLTITGNLVDDPELRYTPSGQPVVRFRVASTPRFYDKASGEWKDGESVFLTCQAWKQLGENVAETVTQGTRVIVTGRLRQRVLRDQGAREAHRLRDRVRRGRRIAEERHGQGHQGHPDQHREWRPRRPGRAGPMGLRALRRLLRRASVLGLLLPQAGGTRSGISRGGCPVRSQRACYP